MVTASVSQRNATIPKTFTGMTQLADACANQKIATLLLSMATGCQVTTTPRLASVFVSSLPQSKTQLDSTGIMPLADSRSCLRNAIRTNFGICKLFHVAAHLDHAQLATFIT